jgi:hypothetical protein
MNYREIIEAARKKNLMADAGGGGGAGGGGAGGGAGSGAGAGAGGGAGPGNGSGGGAHGTSSGGGGSAGGGDTSPSSSTSSGGFIGYGLGTWNTSKKKKKKKKKAKVGTVKDGIYEDVAELEKKKYELEASLERAREITKDIKRDDTHIDILSKLGTLAEEVGLTLDDYQERVVLQLHNKLESEIYQLEEVFTDAIRDIDNQIEELTYVDDE